MNKSCVFCGNKHLTPQNVQYIYKHDGELIIVNDVPCILCDFCGEQYFDGEVIGKIEAMYFDFKQNHRIPKTKIVVPVENYLEAFA